MAANDNNPFVRIARISPKVWARLAEAAYLAGRQADAEAFIDVIYAAYDAHDPAC
ncbi:MAG: hypothetical protein AB7F35_26535 [Acetobacteraceae bacterium]